jgi:hypothetical protein
MLAVRRFMRLAGQVRRSIIRSLRRSLVSLCASLLVVGATAAGCRSSALSPEGGDAAGAGGTSVAGASGDIATAGSLGSTGSGGAAGHAEDGAAPLNGDSSGDTIGHCGAAGEACCPFPEPPPPPRDPGFCDSPELACFWVLQGPGQCQHCGSKFEPCCGVGRGAGRTCSAGLSCNGGEDSSPHCD